MGVVIKQITGSSKFYSIDSVNHALLSDLQRKSKMPTEYINKILIDNRGDEIDLCIKLLNLVYYNVVDREYVYDRVYKYAPSILDKWIDCTEITGCVWFKRIDGYGNKRITIVSLSSDFNEDKEYLNILSLKNLSSFEILELSYYSGLLVSEMNKNLFNLEEYIDSIELQKNKLSPRLMELLFKDEDLKKESREYLKDSYNHFNLIVNLVFKSEAERNYPNLINVVCDKILYTSSASDLLSFCINILLYCSDKREYLYMILNYNRYLLNIEDTFSEEDLLSSAIYITPFGIRGRIVKLNSYGPDDLRSRIKLNELTSAQILEISKIINIPVSGMNYKLFNEFQYNIALGIQS